MEPPRNRSATWTTLRSVRGPLVLSALAGLVCESFSAVFPGLNQMLVDDVLVAKTMSLPHIALLYSGCALGVLVFSYVTGILAWRMGLRYEQRLKNTYIERLWSLPTWKARQTGVTGHVSRLSNDITVIEQDYVTPFRSCLIYAPLIVVYAVLVTLFTTPLITMILLVGAVIVVATPSGLRRYLARRRQAHLDAVANYTRVIDALLRALNKVNTVTRPSFLRVNAAATAQVADERRRYGQAKVLTLTVVQAETLLLQCAVFVLAGAMALRGGLTIGQAVACVTYATAFIVPIQELVSSLTTIHSTADVRAGIDALCAEPDEPPAEPPPVAPAAAVSVEVSGASIEDLAGSRYSLVLPAGARALVRGDSGSGKTTLLEGLDQTRHIEGPYSLAGVATGPAIRHWVGLADQHAVILPGSFVDNVTIYGTYPLDRARLEPLLEAVPAFEPLLDLTDCTSLSGGEQQFLVACRLVTLDPPLVLLDEPFSALPLDTGLQLLAMMLRLLHGTILCSSHADASIDDLFDQRVRIEQVRMAEPVG